MKKNCKHTVLGFLGINSCIFLTLLVLTLFVDPFYIIRKPIPSKHSRWFYNTMIVDKIQIDMIKSMSVYDSVMLSNSHLANTILTELPSCLKLVVGGANDMDYALVLKELCPNKQCNKLHNHIKKIYWGLELWNPCRSIDRNFFLPDLKKCFLESVKCSFAFLLNKKSGSFRYTNKLTDWLYYWDNEDVQNSQKTFYKKEHEIVSNPAFYKYSNENFHSFDQFVVPYVQENPEVEFHFLIIPYSALQFLGKDYVGELEHYIAYQEYIIRKLSKFKNVTLYGFGDCQFTKNLANYYDHSHYHPGINQFMLYCIKNKLHIINNDLEYTGRVIQNLRDFAENFKEIKKATIANPHMDSLEDLIRQEAEKRGF